MADWGVRRGPGGPPSRRAMTEAEIQQAGATDWEGLLVILSLDWTERIYEDIGLTVGAGARLKEQSRLTLLAQLGKLKTDVGEPGAKRVRRATWAHEFLTVVEQRFGVGPAKAVLAWSEAFWSDLQGDAWDWFAYRMVFVRWSGKLRFGGIDIFELGTVQDRVLKTFMQEYLEPAERLRATLSNSAGWAMSDWDVQVLRRCRERIGGPSAEETRDLLPHIDEAARRRYFQVFWADLMAGVELPRLKPVHMVTEHIVREETCYPDERPLPPPGGLRARNAAILDL